MQQRQQRNERVGLLPSAEETLLHRLSARARAAVQAATAWAQHCPAGTVDLTYTYFPPEDDYGSEVLITLQPHPPSGSVLTIRVISDTTVPFHVHLGNVHDLITAAGLVHARMVPTHLPLFFDPRADVTPADVVALCSAVATAQVRLQLGIVGQRVWAVETWIALYPDRQVRVLHGSNGPVRLMHLLCRWGYGALRTVTFASSNELGWWSLSVCCAASLRADGRLTIRVGASGQLSRCSGSGSTHFMRRRLTPSETCSSNWL